MSQDLEQLVRDAEKQYREESERLSEDLSHYEIHDTSKFDFEKFQAIERAQNQAPLDIVNELKIINERLDADRSERIESEKAGERRDRKTFIVAVLTLLATVAIGVTTILLQLSQQ